jgi:hypothetical protein
VPGADRQAGWYGAGYDDDGGPWSVGAVGAVQVEAGVFADGAGCRGAEYEAQFVWSWLWLVHAIILAWASWLAHSDLRRSVVADR